MAHPALRKEAPRPLVDQGFSGIGLHQALTAVFLDDGAEVIDAVQVNVGQLPDLRFDIPGHGDIDHEDGPVATPPDGRLHRALADHRQGAASRGDDDVVVAKRLRHGTQLRRQGAEAGGQGLGVGDGPVGDGHAADALLGKVFGHPLDGVASAEQQRPLVGQVGEDLLGHGHRRVGD